MEDTEKQWRLIWAQYILFFDESLNSEYDDNLQKGKEVKMPVSRIGFPKLVKNVVGGERRRQHLGKRLTAIERPWYLRLFIKNKASEEKKLNAPEFTYCIIFKFREDSELPIRMIASTNPRSPLSGAWKVSSFSEKPWDKQLLEKLEQDRDEPSKGRRPKSFIRKKKNK
ncbi:hypothetical protein HDU67_009341 [Dinochytrium kinnereticum]|nr:hypothetical protein HDU67_009341 [Dinochytrium kinnereticum]